MDGCEKIHVVFHSFIACFLISVSDHFCTSKKSVKCDVILSIMDTFQQTWCHYNQNGLYYKAVKFKYGFVQWNEIYYRKSAHLCQFFTASSVFTNGKNCL